MVARARVGVVARADAQRSGTHGPENRMQRLCRPSRVYVTVSSDRLPVVRGKMMMVLRTRVVASPMAGNTRRKIGEPVVAPGETVQSHYVMVANNARFTTATAKMLLLQNVEKETKMMQREGKKNQKKNKKNSA